jgi:glyoxylase-like metal-dependent hydrolase (beta-lactamase superfamily II)
MRKRLSIVIAAFISLIVVAGGFTIWYMYVMNNETKKMTPMETTEIVDGIYTVKTLYVNLFIIKSNDEYIVIDAGIGKKPVEEGLRTLEIDPKLVKAVFLTHTDYDHVAGLKAFPNAEIYISEDEEEMINGKRHRAFIINNLNP